MELRPELATVDYLECIIYYTTIASFGSGSQERSGGGDYSHKLDIMHRSGYMN